jgi:hypothetical protein
MVGLSTELIATSGKCENFPRVLYNTYTACSMLFVRRLSLAKFVAINDGENKMAGLKRLKASTQEEEV